MRIFQKLAVLAVTAATVAAVPASADPGRSKTHHRDHFRTSQARHCPPGLAKKNPPCVPPGQARKYDDRRDYDRRRHHDRYGVRIGDILRIDDYRVIRDPRRMNLETRDDWRYYRDGHRAYRVDRETRKILSVIELIDAFTN
ncbi:hypothetical protein [Paracoccus denitrificans]|uniref:hypothetical protein n=1 Tax=Paracoccus denitrificans TaxID=266 RepID=UPI003364C194